MNYRFRRVDIGTLLTLLTTLGVVWAAYSYPARWDMACKTIALLGPRVDAIERKEAADDVRWERVFYELEKIDKKIGR